MTEVARITGLYRYPVKGLSPEPLHAAELKAGECIAWDRAFAIENGKHDFDPANPQHFPKIKFLMLMRDERLAHLRTRFDDTTATLTISEGAGEVARGNLMTSEGRAAIETFISSYMKSELRGTPRIVYAPGFSHSDAPFKLVSIINLATVREVEKLIGKPVDPLRFRANVYIDGLEPWEDHHWVGKTIRLGGATLKGFHKIPRCAATNVDPATAARDMEIPKLLQRVYDHVDLGLYAEVSGAGAIRSGDAVALA
ncbi:MAG: MOSC domain-containing protein [Parvibaculum sp.]|uniref:MOSC domain-containing protein n=1 Tax=Parvibaculum sp. TaxID=2024848 RepID=UPI0025E32BE5|nr:MOSC domain-containing protein [Parvibaculum sp.]MCE9651333.1 MOSC domain-containing protein [Parvibaculum sp.]